MFFYAVRYKFSLEKENSMKSFSINPIFEVVRNTELEMRTFLRFLFKVRAQISSNGAAYV